MTRGWTALEAKVRGSAWLKFVNLHHEAFDSSGSNETNLGTSVGRGEVRQAQAQSLLAPGGALLVEHGYRQGAKVRALFDAARLRDVETAHDVERRERVTSGFKAGDALARG